MRKSLTTLISGIALLASSCSTPQPIEKEIRHFPKVNNPPKVELDEHGAQQFLFVPDDSDLLDYNVFGKNGYHSDIREGYFQIPLINAKAYRTGEGKYREDLPLSKARKTLDQLTSAVMNADGEHLLDNYFALSETLIHPDKLNYLVSHLPKDQQEPEKERIITYFANEIFQSNAPKAFIYDDNGILIQGAYSALNANELPTPRRGNLDRDIKDINGAPVTEKKSLENMEAISYD